jgi:outer membrane lipoprotein-sorting protein
MNLLLSTVLPLFVVGADLPAAPPVIVPAQRTASRAAAPEKTIRSKAIKVKATTPARPAPAIAPAVNAPPASVIKVQSPAPAPRSPAPAPAAALDRNAVIARVEQALTTVKTAEGRFTQVDGYGPASGRFYISRPGKVRFDYSDPEPMYIVSDGVSVSIEEPRRDSFDAVPLSSTPLAVFLRSNVNLKRDNSVRDVRSENGSWFVTLVDGTGEAEGQMILEFRATDFELLGWRSIDGAGEETRVRLSEVKTNVKLRPQLFIVKDPTDRDQDRR